MNKSFYVEEKDRALIDEFVEIHEIKKKETKEKGECFKDINVSKTLVNFIKQYVKQHKTNTDGNRN